MIERSPLQYLSKTFTRSSKVTFPNIRKGLVKVTFPSHLQYLNGSLSKSLRSLKVYFRAVIYACTCKHLFGPSRDGSTIAMIRSCGVNHRTWLYFFFQMYCHCAGVMHFYSNHRGASNKHTVFIHRDSGLSEPVVSEVTDE